MASSYTLLIGNKNYSSWSLRPWILMRVLGLPFDEVVISVTGKGVAGGAVPRDFSPSGLVPCLRVKDEAGAEPATVWDSLAIAEYLGDVCPGGGVWPSDRRSRAMARCVSAEMHAGFGNLRGKMPMNIKKRLVGLEPQAILPEVALDVGRVGQLWATCREEFGAKAAGAEGGPYLFGRFCAADAMFAPVAWRFFTYNHVPAEPLARAYLAALLQHPAMREWEADALREDAEGSAGPPAIPHYDASSVELGGGKSRDVGDDTVEAFVAKLRLLSS